MDKLEEYTLLVVSEVAQMIKDEILEKGHGGGNWQRIVTQVCDSYDKNTTIGYETKDNKDKES